MKLSTVCFCLEGDNVLLGMKKRGFGIGKWNGAGGKVVEPESIRTATVREVFEEFGIRLREEDLTQIAIVHFYFEDEYMFECHVFTATEWEGKPQESDEMRPKWFPIAQLPFDEMWADDEKWLPIVFSGTTIEALACFDAEGKVVKEFSWEERKF